MRFLSTFTGPNYKVNCQKIIKSFCFKAVSARIFPDKIIIFLAGAGKRQYRRYSALTGQILLITLKKKTLKLGIRLLHFGGNNESESDYCMNLTRLLSISVLFSKRFIIHFLITCI